MARTVPGSGAKIKPIFDEIFGVRAVTIIDGGSGYDPNDPPRLTITGCGVPEREALLYPIIDEESGRIVHVRVLDRGAGYNPLRLQIVPLQETPNVISSFDINRIWQKTTNSETGAAFLVQNGDLTDRLRITSDNDPKPSNHLLTEREPGGSSLLEDNSFDSTVIYRGGKNVPLSPEERRFQNNKSIGILANGGLIHTSDWGPYGDIPTAFNVDHVRYPHLKNIDTNYDTLIDNQTYYYHTSKLINEFSYTNGVFEWGKIKPSVWNIEVEFDNRLIFVTDVDETLGRIEVNRLVEVAGKDIRARIANVVRDPVSGVVTRLYLRLFSNDSDDLFYRPGDLCLGDNGFAFRIDAEEIRFPNGIFYIDFGADAAEFGPFIPGQYYFSPKNIRIPKNYQIIWNQYIESNLPTDVHPFGHPMQFSTSPDGLLNGGDLYYNSTGVSEAPSTDYEDEFRPTFIMNSDETNKIYYYCKYHRYMSGYEGDEGYMILDTNAGEDPIENNYYYEDFYQADDEDPNTIDRSRHRNGHSKILGISFDGYPIYGPYGFDDSGNVIKQVSSYRLKVEEELSGARPDVTTPGTINYSVTLSNGKLNIDGSRPLFLEKERGKTYVFDFSDSSLDSEIPLLSTVLDGWHSAGAGEIGNVEYVYSGQGIEYRLDGEIVTYQNFISLYTTATTRELRFTPSVDSPGILYLFAYTTSDAGIRSVQVGYLLGDFVEDYIFDETVGTLDEFNGKFTITPEYPNGTYAYFMTEDLSGNPTYPYVIGPKYHALPIFEGDPIPEIQEVYPTEAKGEVVLDETGQVSYIKMTRKGDNYFGPAEARILGGEGTGAKGTPVVQSVTGLSLLNGGRNYATPPTLIFEGGGGEGAKGAAAINPLGKISSIDVVNPGEFYQTSPYLLIVGGGGIGGKAKATISQGRIDNIEVIEPGNGYTEPPTIIFSRLVNLKRKNRTRQSFNSVTNYLTGLVKTATPSDLTLYVNSTDAYPGSGTIYLNNEEITYTAKDKGRFYGLTRGVNFNYDQRVILDTSQNIDGISTYEYNVGDRVVRRVDNASNKVAKVYDWNPTTRELLVTFEVDELAFIDAGIPSTEDAIVQFDAGVASSSGTGVLPHTVIEETGSSIPLLTVPLGVLENRTFEDDDELDGVGNGIPDLINALTDFENQINLDGGIYNSLYGIEETVGGQNTTLFQVGDSIKDASLPFKYATIVEAGGLSDGVTHEAILNIHLDAVTGNGQNFAVNEVVTGDISGVRGTVVSWNPATAILQVKDIIPYNTGNTNIGIGGYFYKFSENGSVVDAIISSPGTNYSASPTIIIEDVGDIQATATVVMTPAGDQVQSLVITSGGYGIEKTLDGTFNLHPTITFVNDPLDTTGSGATAQVILGGEKIVGNGGASYRIKKIDYESIVRS